MDVIEANSTTTLYERLRASKPVQTLLTPCNNAWFVAVPFCLALIANMFALEIPVYIAVIAMVCFIVLFNRDTKPVIPFFVAMYFGTSAGNSPINNPNGIYQTAWSLGLIIALVCLALVCFSARVVILREYKNFRFKNMKMSAGLLAFGAALMLGGIFSPELSWDNFIFGAVQAIAFGFIYLYFIVTVDWEKCGVSYLAYIMLATGILMCAELLWVYMTVDVVVAGGQIDKALIVTGWGIQNNIGGMMTLSLPFYYYLATKGRFGWLYMIAAAGIFAVSIFTLSRTSILIGACVVVVGNILACILSEKKLMRIITLSATVAAALIAFFIFRERIGELFKSMLNIGLDLNGREDLFLYGLSRFTDNPIFGTGYNIDVPELVTYDMFIPGRYHNMFIQILASCGIVGMFAYLFHLWQAVRVAVKTITPGRIFIVFGIITLIGLSQMDNHFFNIGPGLIYSAMLCFLEGDLKNAERAAAQSAAGETKITETAPAFMGAAGKE